jgi:ABC-type bacteriocin/lantibiotic exporter with double-glycine peptidase domain
MVNSSLWKAYAELIINLVKSVEELDPTANVLPAFKRRLQMTGYSCGVQAVEMVLDYFKLHQEEKKLARELRCSENGTSVSDMKRVIKAYGLRCKTKSHARVKDLRQAIDRGYPIIVSMREGRHWSVVYGISPNHVFVADPAVWINPFVRVPWKNFKGQWDRWLLEIRKPP